MHKDPCTQVGACIVDSTNRVVSIGYNGFPSGIDDDELPWSKTAPTDGATSASEGLLQTKYPYVCHAELNAVLNCSRVFRCDPQMRAYVTMFPCHECAKLLVQAGIRSIVYYGNKYKDKMTGRAARVIFDKSGVEYKQYQGSTICIHLDFNEMAGGGDGLEKTQSETSKTVKDDPNFNSIDYEQE